MAEDQQPLLVSSKKHDVDKTPVTAQELRSARDAFYLWEFIVCVSWGMYVELYSFLFYDVVGFVIQ